MLAHRLNREAEEALQTAADLEPDHPQALLPLGLAYMRIDRPPAATNAFSACRLLEPGNWQALLSLAGIATAEAGRQEAGHLLAQALVDSGAEAREAAKTSPALLVILQAAAESPP